MIYLNVILIPIMIWAAIFSLERKWLAGFFIAVISAMLNAMALMGVI